MNTQTLSINETDWRVYRYNDDPEDPRFSVWVGNEDREIPVYNCPPDGHGVFIDMDAEYGIDSEPLTGLFYIVVGRLLVDGVVDEDELEALPAHERVFCNQLVEQQRCDVGLPRPLQTLLRECRERYTE